MNSPLNLDARSILFEVTLYLSSSFTNFILKIWRSINFITCLCSPAIAIDIYWPLSSSFNVLSSDLGSTMIMFYWAPRELWWAQGAGGAHCGDQAQGANTRWWRIQGAHLHLTGPSISSYFPGRVIVLHESLILNRWVLIFAESSEWGILQ